MSLCVFLHTCSPRLRYTLGVVFEHWLGVPFTITTNREEWKEHKGARLAYGVEPGDERALYLDACGLFLETGVRNVSFTYHEDPLPGLFKTKQGYDVLATIFFLISRYEEYLPDAPKDTHGRFFAKASVAHAYGFLYRPLANEWALFLANTLQEMFPSFRYHAPVYTPELTYDIDLAWAYQYKPIQQNAIHTAAHVWHGRWSQVHLPLAVHLGLTKDPYDTYERLAKHHNINSRYFFLLGDEGIYDKNHPHTTPALQQCIRNLQHTSNSVGIHPSYAASKSFEQTQLEVYRLEQVLDTPVKHSRQHFLRLFLPETYNQLLTLGIEHDYSMGYADDVGFRASSSWAFPWYNLVAEAETQNLQPDLWIHPFCAMDATLKEYLNLTPKQALDCLKQLLQTTRQTGGIFCLLWHNSSFSKLSGWEGWDEVYEQIVLEAISYPSH